MKPHPEYLCIRYYGKEVEMITAEEEIGLTIFFFVVEVLQS